MPFPAPPAWPARATALRDQLASGFEPVAWRDALRDLAHGTRAVLVRQGELRRAVRIADAAAARARAALDTASERLAAARQLSRESEAQVQLAGSERAAAVEGWARALHVLELDPGAVAALQVAAAAAEDVQPLLAPAAGLARARIAGEGAALEGSLAALEGERAELVDEARRLENEEDEPPGAPPWARSSRDGRPGAPLWQAVDLRPEVGASERASIEAALHAAGLLDAWLTPEGALLDPATLDTLLRPAAPVASGRSLAAVLCADPAAALDAALIDRVLATVAYGPTALGTGAQAAIGADGSFVLGPLHGRAAKEQAEHLGAAARAARRARRLAEVRAALDALVARQGEIEAVACAAGRAICGARRRSRGVPLWRGPRCRAAQPRRGRRPGGAGHDRARAGRSGGDTTRRRAPRRASRAARARGGARAAPELDDDALVARREACSQLAGVVAGVARELEALARAREALAGRREQQARARHAGGRPRA